MSLHIYILKYKINKNIKTYFFVEKLRISCSFSAKQQRKKTMYIIALINEINESDRRNRRENEKNTFN